MLGNLIPPAALPSSRSSVGSSLSDSTASSIAVSPLVAPVSPATLAQLAPAGTVAPPAAFDSPEYLVHSAWPRIANTLLRHLRASAKDATQEAVLEELFPAVGATGGMCSSTWGSLLYKGRGKPNAPVLRLVHDRIDAWLGRVFRAALAEPVTRLLADATSLSSGEAAAATAADGVISRIASVLSWFDRFAPLAVRALQFYDACVSRVGDALHPAQTLLARAFRDALAFDDVRHDVLGCVISVIDGVRRNHGNGSGSIHSIHGSMRQQLAPVRAVIGIFEALANPLTAPDSRGVMAVTDPTRSMAADTSLLRGAYSGSLARYYTGECPPASLADAVASAEFELELAASLLHESNAKTVRGDVERTVLPRLCEWIWADFCDDLTAAAWCADDAAGDRLSLWKQALDIVAPVSSEAADAVTTILRQVLRAATKPPSEEFVAAAANGRSDGAAVAARFADLCLRLETSAERVRDVVRRYMVKDLALIAAIDDELRERYAAVDAELAARGVASPSASPATVAAGPLGALATAVVATAVPSSAGAASDAASVTLGDSALAVCRAVARFPHPADTELLVRRAVANAVLNPATCDPPTPEQRGAVSAIAATVQETGGLRLAHGLRRIERDLFAAAAMDEDDSDAGPKEEQSALSALSVRVLDPTAWPHELTARKQAATLRLPPVMQRAIDAFASRFATAPGQARRKLAWNFERGGVTMRASFATGTKEIVAPTAHAALLMTLDASSTPSMSRSELRAVLGVSAESLSSLLCAIDAAAPGMLLMTQSNDDGTDDAVSVNERFQHKLRRVKVTPTTANTAKRGAFGTDSAADASPLAVDCRLLQALKRSDAAVSFADLVRAAAAPQRLVKDRLQLLVDRGFAARADGNAMRFVYLA